MKTFLIAIALIGYSVGAYAQDKKDCLCKGNTAHKVAVVHHKAKNTLPPYVTVLAATPGNNVSCTPVSESCFTYSKDNIVVQECPAAIYPEGNIDFSREGTYMGYYPKTDVSGRGQSVDLEAPQHIVINSYRGIAPADGNSCNGCSSW